MFELRIKPIVQGITGLESLLDNLESAAARHWNSVDTGQKERSWYSDLIASCGLGKSGHMALCNGEPCGFIIWHAEGEKGWLDAMYVHDEIDRAHAARLLIQAAETALCENPSVRHIRNRFYVWPDDYISAPFRALGYRVTKRSNRRLDLDSYKLSAGALKQGYRFIDWADSFIKPAVDLVFEAYKNGEDDVYDYRERSRSQIEVRLDGLFEDGIAPYSTLLFRDDELVGIALVVVYKMKDNSRLPVIQEICITPALRNLGLGSILLNTVLTRMKAAGESSALLSVTETNDNAKHIYSAAGFKITSTMPYVYKTAHNLP